VEFGVDFIRCSSSLTISIDFPSLTKEKQLEDPS